MALGNRHKVKPTRECGLYQHRSAYTRVSLSLIRSFTRNEIDLTRVLETFVKRWRYGDAWDYYFLFNNRQIEAD